MNNADTGMMWTSARQLTDAETVQTGRISVASAGTICSITKINADNCTASGSKAFNGELFYEI